MRENPEATKEDITKAAQYLAWYKRDETMITEQEEKVKNVLKETRVKYDRLMLSLIDIAIRREDINLLLVIVKNCPSLINHKYSKWSHQTGYDPHTPLSVAIKHNVWEQFCLNAINPYQEFLHKGVTVTALQFAVLESNEKLLEKLKEFGGVDDRGLFICAITCKKFDVALDLLRSGAVSIKKDIERLRELRALPQLYDFNPSYHSARVLDELNELNPALVSCFVVLRCLNSTKLLEERSEMLTPTPVLPHAAQAFQGMHKTLLPYYGSHNQYALNTLQTEQAKELANELFIGENRHIDVKNGDMIIFMNQRRVLLSINGLMLASGPPLEGFLISAGADIREVLASGANSAIMHLHTVSGNYTQEFLDALLRRGANPNHEAIIANAIAL